jgi:hypothetical protein
MAAASELLGTARAMLATEQCASRVIATDRIDVLEAETQDALLRVIAADVAMIGAMERYIGARKAMANVARMRVDAIETWRGAHKRSRAARIEALQTVVHALTDVTSAPDKRQLRMTSTTREAARLDAGARIANAAFEAVETQEAGLRRSMTAAWDTAVRTQVAFARGKAALDAAAKLEFDAKRVATSALAAALSEQEAAVRADAERDETERDETERDETERDHAAVAIMMLARASGRCKPPASS